MTVHDIFEQYFSDQIDVPLDSIRMSRLTNGSYSHPRYASAFRMFKAGFESNHGEKMKNAFEYEQEIKGLLEERDSTQACLELSIDREAKLVERLARADKCNTEMAALLVMIRHTRGTMLMTNPPQDPWAYHRFEDQIRVCLENVIGLNNI